jgi:hypothetical protein
MYDYETPDGYGDSFYVYVYNPAESGLVSGESYSYVPIQIQDGAFILRAWSGADSVLAHTGVLATWGTIQLYDPHSRLFWDLPTSVFSNCATGAAVLPEKSYPDNSALRFDLANTELALDATAVVPVSQLAFYGVRRIQGGASDPAQSQYRYKEIDFSIPFTFPLQGNGTAAGPGPLTQYTVQIQDYDFELRRIEYGIFTYPQVIVSNEIVGVLFQALEGGASIKYVSGVPGQFTATAVGAALTVTVDPNMLVSTFLTLFAGNTVASALMIAQALFGTPQFANVNGLSWVSGVAIAFPGGVPAAGSGNPIHPEFQITLYDANWRARSNAPVNCNRLLHYKLFSSTTPYNPMNNYPAPGILYPVNGVIRFDVLSLIPATGNLPNIYLVFKGVRRLPC